MEKIIGVKFREQGQIYYFYSNQDHPQVDDLVVVSTEEGQGLATVVIVRDELPPDITLQEIKPIDRIAGEEDTVRQEKNQEMARQAYESCQQYIRQLDLEMKLVDVEVRFDQSKIVFYFTAPTRIDFRELVKLLVNEYRTRIELRQIGVRHEAQILGGLGNCGRICCCHQFLRKFEPVTIKMAKEQQLFLNPSKISGTCGRLLCCLNFEKEAYADFHRRCPKVGKKYQTPAGELKVLRANLFRDSLVVGTGDGEEKEVTLLEWSDLIVDSEETANYEFLFAQNQKAESCTVPVIEEQTVQTAENPSGNNPEERPKEKPASSENKQGEEPTRKRKPRQSKAQKKGKESSSSRKRKRRSRKKKS